MMVGLTQAATVWLAATSLMAVLCFVLALVLFFKHAGLKKQVRRWKSIHETADLERVYDETVEAVRRVRADMERVEDQLDALQQQLRKKVGTPQVRRFNAFAETGSDLSYAVALVDDHLDGVVLSSIFGREESRTYAKPIYKGQSDYSLTEEERDVLESAQHKDGLVRV
ncbi:MAG: DUF4446 family protein [Alicyclobacillus sp.]|nr:DUF4446 family protein [Alicyclobacillus sp.]